MAKVTMQDIADQLNISKNSVSQALRGKSGVSDKTKALVKKTADELGYHYNFSGEPDDPQSRRTKKFLLLASSFALSQASFFGKILSSIENSVEQSGSQLRVIEITDQDIQEHILKNELTGQEWDGIFIMSHINDPFIEKVISFGCPCVLIDHHHPHFKADAILTQNQKGAYSAVEYLIQNNHKKIGFIGDISFSPSYNDRLTGYTKVLKDYSIEYDEHYVISDSKESQRNLYSRLDSLDDMPSAWFCVNSGLAFILNSYLHSKGYSVPEDVSILCFDDTEFTRLSQPQLTCISTDLGYMGKSAVDLMAYRISHPDNPHLEINIAPELIVRSST